MGIFDFFKKKEEKPKVSLDLQKKEQTIKLCLEKKNVKSLVAEVKFSLDCSGSMSELYRNGEVKEIFERIAPIAFKLDDNQLMECSLFNTDLYKIKDITPNNLEDYVERCNLKSYVGGGTNYSHIIRDAIEYTKSGKAKFPIFVIIITDGENFDKKETTRALIEASKYDIYFQFVGIGTESFTYLKKLDELEGRKFDNAGFIGIESIKKLSDERLYQALLDEFVDINKQGILKSSKITLNLNK